MNDTVYGKKRFAEGGYVSVSPDEVGDTSLQSQMKKLGMNPNAERLSVLPAPTDAIAGKDKIDWTDWTAPKWLADMVKATMLPGHAIQGGKYDLEDVSEAALNLAGTGTAASMAVKGTPKGSVDAGMFTGVRSKLFMKEPQQNAYRQAKSMDETISVPDKKYNIRSQADKIRDIRGATNWHRGEDTSWRYELADDTSFVRPEVFPKTRYTTDAKGNVINPAARLERYLDHPKLFESYPELRNMVVIRSPATKDGVKGYYDPNAKFIVTDGELTMVPRKLTKDEHAEYGSLFNTMPVFDSSKMAASKAADEVWAKSPQGQRYLELNHIMTGLKEAIPVDKTLLHELQHAIQHIEDHAAGGSPSMFTLHTRWQLMKDNPSPKLKRDLVHESDHALYERIFGEAEARATADRSSIPQNRRNTSEHSLYYLSAPEDHIVLNWSDKPRKKQP